MSGLLQLKLIRFIVLGTIREGYSSVSWIGSSGSQTANLEWFDPVYLAQDQCMWEDLYIFNFDVLEAAQHIVLLEGKTCHDSPRLEPDPKGIHHLSLIIDEVEDICCGCEERGVSRVWRRKFTKRVF